MTTEVIEPLPSSVKFTDLLKIEKPEDKNKSETVSEESKKADETAVSAKDSESHENQNTTYSAVFANDLAASALKNKKKSFPVGSIIVREKLLKIDDVQPELVTVMVKRQKGFSEKTDDWEFLVIDGKIDKIEKRETIGSCAACHTNAKQTDWVFREYLGK